MFGLERAGPADAGPALPFDSALPNLRMNRAAARFTNSKTEEPAVFIRSIYS